ncbi:retrovirus-related pol polyprotein from transposon TNT 1-94 [Tanacetum coccineum]
MYFVRSVVQECDRHDSDVEEDTRSSKEFLADLNLEFHDRTLLSNQRRFYKFPGRVGIAKKPMEKSNETCFPFGKQGHFQKDCPTNKTSSPSYLYKALNAKLALLTQKIKVVSKNKSEKGLVAESYDWDEESLSSEDEGVTTVRAFMGIVEDELAVKKTNVRSSQWVKITMKKVQRILTMNDGDETKHVLDYTKYRPPLCGISKEKLVQQITRLNLDNESLKDEVSDLKRVIEKWTSSKVTLDQLLTEQVLGNIVRSMGRRGKRKETISSKDVVFFMGEKSPFETAHNSTSNTESVNDQDPLPPLPKLSGAELVGTSNDIIPPTDLIYTSTIFDKTKQVTEKESLIKYVKKKAQTKTPSVPNSKPEKKVDSSTEQLLLTLMKEVKGLKVQIKPLYDNSSSVSQTRSSKSGKNKQKAKFGPCKHCGFKNHLSKDSYNKPQCSICQSTNHLCHTPKIS